MFKNINTIILIDYFSDNDIKIKFFFVIFNFDTLHNKLEFVPIGEENSITKTASINPMIILFGLLCQIKIPNVNITH